MTDFLVTVPAFVNLRITAESEEEALALAQGHTWDLEGISLVDFKHPETIRFEGLTTYDPGAYVVDELDE